MTVSSFQSIGLASAASAQWQQLGDLYPLASAGHGGVIGAEPWPRGSARACSYDEPHLISMSSSSM